jgi:diacylglycerol kinase family enzyme
MPSSRKEKASLICNPVAGQRYSNEDIRITKEIIGPVMSLEIIETKKDSDADPAFPAKDVIDIIKKNIENQHGSSAMIIASGEDGIVSAIAGATVGSEEVPQMHFLFLSEFHQMVGPFV